MKDRPRVAIIGFGGMGQRHFLSCQKIGAKVVAVCDADRSKADRLVQDHPDIRVYGDYADLLADNSLGLDLVTVVTNGPSHAQIAVAAAEAGVRNIFCEKPMATNLRDAQRMIDASSRSGSRLAVNHIRRWSPNHWKLKKLLQQGVIGDVRHISFHCGSTGLGNMGGHFFDNMRFYTDSEVDWVIAFLDDTGTPNPRGAQFLDPGGYGILRFRNGVRGFLDSSEDTGVPHVCHMVGAYGRVVVDELSDLWKVSARSEDDRRLPLTRYVLPLQEVPFEVETRFDIVELTARGIAELGSGGPLACAGEDGKKALELVVAFHASHRMCNQRLDLPLDGDLLDLDIPIA